MAHFPLLQADDATPAQQEVFDRAEAAFGMVPNLIRVLAHSPATAEAYLDLGERFSATSLTPVEQQTVLLAVSHENACTYCMAAHSALAKQAGMGDEVLAALRAGETLDDPRLHALSELTRSVVRNDGHPGADRVQAFHDVGFAEPDYEAVVLGVAMKTLSNYTNHAADTPVDEPFQALAWEPTEPVTV
jgi:uncharacterized peroxidase-related enzyme